MPLATGGAQSIFTNWWTAQAATLALFTGPAVTGSSGNELTTGGYQRGQFGTNPWSYDAATGRFSNANLITLGRLTAQSQRITHWAVLDSTGVIIYRSAFTPAPGVLAANRPLEVEAGRLNIRIPFA